MLWFLSLLIVAVSSVAALLTLTWFIQYATHWLLPPDRRADAGRINPNPRPYHVKA